MMVSCHAAAAAAQVNQIVSQGRRTPYKHKLVIMAYNIKLVICQVLFLLNAYFFVYIYSQD